MTAIRETEPQQQSARIEIPPLGGSIFAFIVQEDPRRGFLTLAVAVVTGLALSHLIVYIGLLTTEARAGAIDAGDVVWFALALFVVVALQYTAMLAAISTTERCLFSLLSRLAARIRATSLETLECEGTDSLYVSISQAGTTISNATLLAAVTLQNLAVLAGCALYLAGAMPGVFFFLCVFGAIWQGLHRIAQHDLRRQEQAAANSERGFNASIQEITEGFRELMLDPRKMRALMAEVAKPAAQQTRMDRLLVNAYFLRQLRAQGTIWLFAMAFLACVYPQLGSWDEAATAFMIMGFLWLPSTDAVTSLPNLLRAKNAISSMHALEARLPPESGGMTKPIHLGRPRFESLALRGVSYRYPAETGGRAFSVGPIDLHLTSGEVVFLTGGNGSGKSTLIKVLTGLYPCHAGTLLVNGQHKTAPEHRSLFSYVPTDFHLFDRLYGISPEAYEEGAELLQRLALARLVAIRDGRFTTTSLSTGQRKRLGLAVALMERRPIVVLDEWAADQDPKYRQLFYEELVPVFRQRGRTVIAASHDDRYFHTADRVIKMRDGVIIEDRLP